MSWSGEVQVRSAIGTKPYFFTIYLPQAIGIYVSNVLNLSLHETYFAVRLTVLLAISCCFFVSFSLVNPNIFTLFVLMMPMTVFQFASTTIDALSTALSVLGLSIFCATAKKRWQCSTFHLVIMLAALIVVTTSRLHTLPILLLPCFMILKSRRWTQLPLVTVSVIFVLWWFFKISSNQVVSQEKITASNFEIIIHYLSNPLHFASLLSATLNHYGYFYFSSFIGNLGWLDTSFSRPFYLITGVALTAAFVSSVSLTHLKTSLKPNLLLAIVCIASVLLIFSALLIAWTSHPAELIVGVQGRYFIIPALILSYCLSDSDSESSQLLYMRLSIVSVWAVSMVYCTVALLLDRYY